MRLKKQGLGLIFLVMALHFQVFAQSPQEIVDTHPELCNCKGLETAKTEVEFQKANEQLSVSWVILISKTPQPLSDTIKWIEAFTHPPGASFSGSLKGLAAQLRIPPAFHPYFVGTTMKLGGQETFEKQKFILACLYAKIRLYRASPTPLPVNTPTVDDSTRAVETPPATSNIEDKLDQLLLFQGGLIALALSLLVVNLILLLHRGKPQKEAIVSVPPVETDAKEPKNLDLTKLYDQGRVILSTLSNLEKQVVELRNKSEVTKLPVQNLSNSDSAKYQAPSPSGAIKSIYSSHPEGDYFTRLTDAFELQKSVYQIKINQRNPNEASYTIVEDPDTRSLHYNFPDALRQACHLKGIGIPPLNARIQEGKAVRDGEIWKITQKIELSW